MSEIMEKEVEKVVEEMIGMKQCKSKKENPKGIYCGKWKLEGEFSKGNMCRECKALMAKKIRANDTREFKTCSKCNETKSGNEFEKATITCFKCRYEVRVENDVAPFKTCRDCGITKAREYCVNGQLLCKDCDTVRAKKQYANDNKEIKTCRECGKITPGDESKKGANLCSECHAEQNRIYRADPKNKQKNSEKERNRRKTDPKYRLDKNVAAAIWADLKKKGGSKNRHHWEDMVGYLLEELIYHLLNHPEKEEWMILENNSDFNPESLNDPSKRSWHLDHIIAKKHFKYEFDENENLTEQGLIEFRKCWALENLRPLEARKNLKKGAK